MEIPVTPPLEARLSALGITQQDIERTKQFVPRIGSNPNYDPTKNLMGIDPYYDGNYHFALRESIELLRKKPSVDVPTTVQERRGLLRKKVVRIETQRREIEPVDNLAEQITTYTRTLLDKGVEPVRIVDFGAGAGFTMRKSASMMQDEIATKRVKIIATNVEGGHPLDAPSSTDVQFAHADILELYDKLKDNPVHLLFMVNMFSFTQHFNDVLLKIAGEMVHPDYGTAVLGLSNLKDPVHTQLLPENRSKLTLGLIGLQEKGFKHIYPFVVGEGEYHLADWANFPIDVYQGKKAPPLPLYQIGNAIDQHQL